MADNDLQIVLPESDEVLTCPKCKTANPLDSNFCLNCGTRLIIPSRSNFKWSWFVFLVVCVAGYIVYYYLQITEPELQQKVPIEISDAETPAPRIAEAKTNIPKKEVPLNKDEAISLSTPSKTKISVGIVLIKDISGKIINEIPAPVIGGGWVALPTRACLGGFEWVLKMGSELEVSILAGIYSDYDKVGLWRISEDFKIDGPQLYPWSGDEQLTWLSLTSTDTSETVALDNPNVQGYFTEGILTGDARDSGVLMQQDRAVGWTFGDAVAGAFVWHGDEGKYLQPEIRVDDFYRITFANSREEEFTRALAMGADYSNIERLEAFAAAFAYDTKLSAAETPAHLQSKSVLENMNKLVVAASKAGLNREVANIFESQFLIEAADVELLLNVTRATTQGYGFDEAIELVENVVDSLPKISEPDSILLANFFSELYQNWITVLLNQGNLQAAWSAYRLGSRRLPDDVNIHLLGVQLALAENNWVEAEELLAMKEYPASLSDKIKNLQNQISDIKGQEGKIVINFSPGSRQIPLTAILNRSSPQKFIVDTGASMVTIPRSTALELGLDIPISNRKVFTAGGVQYASEVNISSITIEGWEVDNVKALVLDIPNQPDWGLLGLNYLERFRMDMNTEEGILLLEPR
jgi:clan AA aspartic protease (TIGR02281 family)